MWSFFAYSHLLSDVSCFSSIVVLCRLVYPKLKLLKWSVRLTRKVLVQWAAKLISPSWRTLGGFEEASDFGTGSLLVAKKSKHHEWVRAGLGRPSLHENVLQGSASVCHQGSSTAAMVCCRMTQIRSDGIGNIRPTTISWNKILTSIKDRIEVIINVISSKHCCPFQVLEASFKLEELQ